MNKYDDDVITKIRHMIDNSYFKDLIMAVKTNGKSKTLEDFNILEEYQSKFMETPSLLKITDDDCDIFQHDKLKSLLTKEFPESKIVFNDTDYNLKRNKYISNREVWHISDGYMLNLWTGESKSMYANPELDIKLNEHESLIEGNTLLVPPHNSTKTNKETEKLIIDIFRKSLVKEYDRNSIGMMSVDGNGELYVKEFTLDKKFRIKDLDLHYGIGFKDFYNNLFRKLKSDKKGLVLLHGDPGTGKCVHGKTKIIVRDKITGNIKKINIEDL